MKVGGFGAADAMRRPAVPQTPGPGFCRWSGDFGARVTMVRDALSHHPPGTRVYFRAFGKVLYPRRHCFAHNGDAENPENVYLGEDCAGKRHSDCVGFVNRVLSNVLGRPIRYGLPDPCRRRPEWCRGDGRQCE